MTVDLPLMSLRSAVPLRAGWSIGIVATLTPVRVRRAVDGLDRVRVHPRLIGSSGQLL